MALYYVNGAEMELFPRIPLLVWFCVNVGNKGNFTPDLEEEVKQQAHYFYPVKVAEVPKH